MQYQVPIDAKAHDDHGSSTEDQAFIGPTSRIRAQAPFSNPPGEKPDGAIHDRSFYTTFNRKYKQSMINLSIDFLQFFHAIHI